MHRVHGGARARRVPSTPSLRHAAGVALAAYRKTQARQEARESPARRFRRQYARLLTSTIQAVAPWDPYSYNSTLPASGSLTITADTASDIGGTGIQIASSVVTGITVTTYPSGGPSVILAERVYQDLVNELLELRAQVGRLERALAARRTPSVAPVIPPTRRSFALEDP